MRCKRSLNLRHRLGSSSLYEILQPLYPQGLVKKIQCDLPSVKAVRNQLESVTRPEMTNKFTMREMIEETLNVYQNLVIWRWQRAEADAAAVRRIKKLFETHCQPNNKAKICDARAKQERFACQYRTY
jgi:hypothetical protein